MLFSATLNAWVKNLAWEYTKNPFEIEIEPETVTVEEVDQILYHVPSEDKMRLLLGILAREKPESAIIFCNTKRYTEIIAKRLRMNGYECEFIIGDLPQSKRLKIIDDVKAGNIRYLVATDVAARGLDIEGLTMVLNYDLPVESENYVHRIGRTARAGKTGKAITLASEQDVYELPDIEKYIGKKIPALIAGEELYAEDKSAGLRIRTEFAGDGLFGKRDGSGRFGRGEKDRRGSHKEGGFGFQGRDKTRRDDRPSGRRGQGASLRDQTREFEEAERARVDTGPGGSEDLGKLSFEQRMTYYRQKYKEQANGPQTPDQSIEAGASRSQGNDAGKRDKSAGNKDRKRRAPVKKTTAQAESPRRSEGQRKAQGAFSGQTGGPTQGAANTSRPGSGKPPQSRPQTQTGKAAGRRRGPRGNQAGARDRGVANRTGTAGQDSKTLQQDQRAPARDAATGKGPATGTGKGFLGKLLSVFKRKK
jgi:ATP-dependent RNA helicase RhlB